MKVIIPIHFKVYAFDNQFQNVSYSLSFVRILVMWSINFTLGIPNLFIRFGFFIR